MADKAEEVFEAWDKLSRDEKVAAKKKYKTTMNWYEVVIEGKSVGKKKRTRRTKAQMEAARASKDKQEEVHGRVYGPDQRDQKAFKRLTVQEQKAVLVRWKDPYAWYLCELTNIIAAGLREKYTPGDLAKQYGLTLEEIKQCRPLPG